MELLREALEDTIRTTPFNTFRNVLLAAGEESPMELGGNCRYQLQVLSDKIGTGNLRYIQAPKSPHFTGIVENKDGIFLVDPTLMTCEPVNIESVLDGTKSSIVANAFPFVKRKPSRVIVMRKPPEDGEDTNSIHVMKQRIMGNNYALEKNWEFDLNQQQDKLPPERQVHQMTIQSGIVSLRVLMPDLSVHEVRQKVGETRRTAAKIGGHRDYAKHTEHERAEFAAIISGITTQTNVRAKVLLDCIDRATRLYSMIRFP